MNWVDLAIFAVVLFFAAESQRRGFVNEVVNIFGLLFSLIGSLFFYPWIAALLIKFFTLPKIAVAPISFLLAWLVLETIFFWLLNKFGTKFLQKLLDKPVNKHFGFIPGAINALLFSAFVLLFTISLPINPTIKKDVFDSKIGAYLVEKATVLERPFNNIFGPIAKQSLTFLTVNPEDKHSVDLQYTQNERTTDFEGEQEIFRLVNEERAKNGIKPLVWEETRAEVGRLHSGDMFARGYFSHYSPEGKDVGDRLEEGGITYTIAGENLALAPDIRRAHTGLINSPGHRRNILDPAFRRIGIGVIDGGVYGKMVTQVFTD